MSYIDNQINYYKYIEILSIVLFARNFVTLEPLGVPDHMGFPWPLQLLHDGLVSLRGTRGTHYPHVPLCLNLAPDHIPKAQRNHTIAEQPGPGSVSKDTSRILRTCEAK